MSDYNPTNRFYSFYQSSLMSYGNLNSVPDTVKPSDNRNKIIGNTYNNYKNNQNSRNSNNQIDRGWVGDPKRDEEVAVDSFERHMNDTSKNTRLVLA